MNEDQKSLSIKLAKSRTKDVDVFEVIKSLNKESCEYLDARKDEFVTYRFLEYGNRQWGKVTSNAVERVNGLLLVERLLPILFMIEGINKYKRDKFA
jgi:hypothetical protein